MAYKQKGFGAHDNMKTKSKDLSGRASINQRTPQIKPGDAPSKISVEEAWNTGSDVGGAMGSQAGGAASNIHRMQRTSGFVNNPLLADFKGDDPKTSQRQFGATETGMGGRSTVASTITKDASEVAAKGRGSIQDMINQTISNVQTTQDAKRATALNKYKGELAAKRAATKSAYDSSIDAWKTKYGASQSKNKALQSAHKKMLEAQKAAAAKAAAARRRRRSSRNPVTKVLGGVGKVVGGVGKVVGGVVKGATKVVGGVVKDVRRFIRRILGGRRRRKGKKKKSVVKKATKTVKKVGKKIGRAIKRLFGRRRRRRRRSVPKKATTATTKKVAVKSTPRKGGRRRRFFGRRRRRRSAVRTRPKTVAPKKATVRRAAPKKAAVKRGGRRRLFGRRRRRRGRRGRRRWSDVRLKQNIRLMGLSPTGIPIYNFSYIGDNTIYQGTMAQDLLSMGYDSAITTDSKSGYYMVDYDQIDIDMIKI